jgi:DNA-binding LacI/PurR family transcriptional regulator
MSEVVKTIVDIAKLAEVSVSTVSRALNNSPLISKQTRERLQAIAKAHDFEIHHNARNLILQRSQTIGLVISIAPNVGRFITDPIYLELLGAIALTIGESEYDLMVIQVQEDNTRCIQRYLKSKRVGGFILHTSQAYAQEIFRLIGRQAPIILWGSPAPNQEYCSVSSDDVTGAHLAVQHLIRLGRTRIAFLGGTQGEASIFRRYQGYAETLGEAGQALNPAFVTYAEYTSQSGYDAMQKLLQQAPDLNAVFVCSDVMAIGAMEALRERGCHIPQDVAVVGYDGISLSAHCSPPLTTVQQNIAKAGKFLVQNLIQYLKDGVITTTTLPVELVIRKSSGTSS